MYPIGPIQPATSRGNCYILTLTVVNFATRYDEVVHFKQRNREGCRSII